MEEKKITLATIKSFIRKNKEHLHIDCKSSFDGMVDCVMPCKGHGFEKATMVDKGHAHNLGIDGAWFVGQSRDSFSNVVSDDYEGFYISNCCGSFSIAIPKIQKNAV